MSTDLSSLEPMGAVGTDRYSRRLWMHAGALASVVIVCIAFWALYNTAHRVQSRDVITAFRAVSTGDLVLAFCLTIASYLVVIGYDIVALNHLGRPLPRWRAALAAFLAAAFGNSIGFSMVTGASIRYRIYSIAGLSALEIAGVSTLCTMTTALGMFCILAVALLFDTGTATASAAHMSPFLRYTVGSLLMLVMGGYIIVSSIRPMVIRTDNWSLNLPSAGTAMAQVLLGTLDMSLVGTLIYALLPGDVAVGYLSFLGVFVLAMLAGGMSHVPGGIGVFETLLLIGLPEVPPATLLGAVLVFRCVYFILPLVCGAVAFAVYEALLQRAHLTRVHGVVSEWLAEVGPQVMAALIVLTGVVLLFSTTLPTGAGQLTMLKAYLPLALIEAAHIVTAVCGFGLMFLARGLTRRLRSAYYGAAIVLVVGTLSSFLKDLSFREVYILLPALLILLPTKPEFNRRAPLLGQAFTVEWLSTLSVILVMTIWLGFFNFKHVAYTHSLWTKFSYAGDVSRFMRSMAATGLFALGVGLINIVRRGAEPAFLPAPALLSRVSELLAKETETRANLALMGDKRLLFNSTGTAFIMYQVQGKSWVALGDPVGPPEERGALLWQYRELCERHGGWPVFYLVDAANVALYVDLGLSLIKLGDEARVPLEQFFIQSVGNVDIRKEHRQVAAQQVDFEIVEAVDVPALLPELAVVSNLWLSANQEKEFGFARGHFRADYVSRFPCAVARQDGRIIAFAVIWAGAQNDEIALDLLRYRPDAPAGILHYLLVELLLKSKSEGYRWFNLGIAPLTNIDANPMAPVWHRVGKLIYRQSEHFKNIESLRVFEENFKPVWRAKYLASPGGFNAPRILRDIARLTARSS